MEVLNYLTNEGGTTQGNSVTFYIIIGVMLVAVIGFMIWQSISGKKKQKEAQNMVDSIKIGDKVKTIGGVCGYVAEINNAENTIVLETGTNDKKSYVKFDKGAIYQTAPVGSEAKVEEKKEEVKEEKVEEKKEEVKPAEKKTKKAPAKKEAVEEKKEETENK